ncbi:hypothetical protein SPI_07719 [Niveomyces insectorum RCEF 264]|uniref:Uncharacterized protein n=1 Tax=Niveomyces insectorum RCEF 264 TaxID=1081102 RepID=A0A167PJ25_9HYPO|nr:hypothetical protein SPI_07719 [Niveomyces insectorum RCEF 264]
MKAVSLSAALLLWAGVAAATPSSSVTATPTIADASPTLSGPPTSSSSVYCPNMLLYSDFSSPPPWFQPPWEEEYRRQTPGGRAAMDTPTYCAGYSSCLSVELSGDVAAWAYQYVVFPYTGTYTAVVWFRVTGIDPVADETLQFAVNGVPVGETQPVYGVSINTWHSFTTQFEAEQTDISFNVDTFGVLFSQSQGAGDAILVTDVELIECGMNGICFPCPIHFARSPHMVFWASPDFFQQQFFQQQFICAIVKAQLARPAIFLSNTGATFPPTSSFDCPPSDQ